MLRQFSSVNGLSLLDFALLHHMAKAGIHTLVFLQQRTRAQVLINISFAPVCVLRQTETPCSEDTILRSGKAGLPYGSRPQRRELQRNPSSHFDWTGGIAQLLMYGRKACKLVPKKSAPATMTARTPALNFCRSMRFQWNC